MPIKRPFNLRTWISENQDKLTPPVNNRNIYADAHDYIVMIVGGPNARRDYHYNSTEELFYQIQGDINIRIQEDEKVTEVTLHEGDIFLLPAKVLHSPIRPAHSIGLVIECKRSSEDYKDGLIWFCETCNNKLHEVYFHLTNIERDFHPHFRNFYSSEKLRTCKKCGTIMETNPNFI